MKWVLLIVAGVALIVAGATCWKVTKIEKYDAQVAIWNDSVYTWIKKANQKIDWTRVGAPDTPPPPGPPPKW